MRKALLIVVVLGLLVGVTAVAAQNQTQPKFKDNRINSDAFATFTAYCRKDGIEVLALDSKAAGQFAFKATNEDIAAVGNVTATTMIAEGEGISLSRLATNDLTIVGAPDKEGKRYSIVFNGCPVTKIQSSVSK